MKNNLPTCASILLAAFLTSLVLPSGAAMADEVKPAEVPTLSREVYLATETAEFIKLAKETLVALAAGKQTEMVAKLTDLETAWDDQEAVLKPKSEATWTLLDKTLDRAISALRSSRANPAKGKVALEELLAELLKVSGP
jgi:hypothetical protein